MGVRLEVLFVEDSETDTKLMLRELRKGGFSPRWQRVETAGALRDALSRKQWQVVISDSSVPRLGAVEVLRRGAADYVTKENLQRLGPAVVHDQRVHKALSLADQALLQLHDFAVELWPTVLDDLGLPARGGLAELCDLARGRGGAARRAEQGATRPRAWREAHAAPARGPRHRGLRGGLEARAARPEMAVLLMSGFSDHAVVEKALAEGADHLQKPFTPDTLAERVRAILDRAQGR
jgi:CheY-like chemotaxis protein